MFYSKSEKTPSTFIETKVVQKKKLIVYIFYLTVTDEFISKESLMETVHIICTVLGQIVSELENVSHLLSRRLKKIIFLDHVNVFSKLLQS